jgi:hypothetical protein
MPLLYIHPKAMRKSPPLYCYSLFITGISVHILYQLSIHSLLLWCKDCIPFLYFALSLSRLDETIKLRAPYPVLPNPNFDNLELVAANPLSDSSNVYFHDLSNLFGCKHLVTLHTSISN